MFGILKRLFGFRETQNAPEKEKRTNINEKSPEELAKMTRRIKRYPVKKLTRKEFNKLPKNVDTEFLKTCPIGTWFVCKPMSEIPDLVVIGRVVKGEDMFVEQFGAGLFCGPREREINRYCLEIIRESRPAHNSDNRRRKNICRIPKRKRRQ